MMQHPLRTSIVFDMLGQGLQLGTIHFSRLATRGAASTPPQRHFGTVSVMIGAAVIAFRHDHICPARGAQARVTRVFAARAIPAAPPMQLVANAGPRSQAQDSGSAGGDAVDVQAAGTRPRSQKQGHSAASRIATSLKSLVAAHASMESFASHSQ